MKLNFKVHLLNSLFVVVLLCLLAIVANAETAAQAVYTADKNWLAHNWQIVALFLSEVIAFVPTKAQGLAHALFLGLQTLAKKKRP